MKSALDVINKGYNAIRQHGELFRIIGGNGEILYLRHEASGEYGASIYVDNVEEFITLNK